MVLSPILRNIRLYGVQQHAERSECGHVLLACNSGVVSGCLGRRCALGVSICSLRAISLDALPEPTDEVGVRQWLTQASLDQPPAEYDSPGPLDDYAQRIMEQQIKPAIPAQGCERFFQPSLDHLSEAERAALEKNQRHFFSILVENRPVHRLALLPGLCSEEHCCCGRRRVAGRAPALLGAGVPDAIQPGESVPRPIHRPRGTAPVRCRGGAKGDADVVDLPKSDGANHTRMWLVNCSEASIVEESKLAAEQSAAEPAWRRGPGQRGCLDASLLSPACGGIRRGRAQHDTG